MFSFDFVGSYSRCLKRFRYLVLVTWICVFSSLAYLGWNIDSVDADHGLTWKSTEESKHERELYQDYCSPLHWDIMGAANHSGFPEIDNHKRRNLLNSYSFRRDLGFDGDGICNGNTGTLFVLIERLDGKHIISTETELLVGKLVNDIRPIIELYCVWGYYDSVLSFGDHLKHLFVADDNSTIILQLHANRHEADYRQDVEELQDQINESPDYDVTFASQMWIDEDIKDIFTHYAPFVECVTIPMALSIMLYMIQSWKFCILTISNMIVSYFCAFGLLYITITQGNLWFDSMTKQFTGILCLAMNIDYSLFLFIRFRQEMSEHGEFDQAVENMLRYAGHVVLTAGLTLLTCNFGMLALQYDPITTCALANAFAIFSCLPVSLCLAPTIMFCAPNFFSSFDYCPYFTICAGTPNDSQKATNNMKSSCWFKGSRIITKWPYNLVTLMCVYMICIPLLIFSFQLEVSIEAATFNTSLLPTWKTFETIFEKYPKGIIEPVNICFISESGIADDEFFSQGKNFLQEMNDLKGFDLQYTISTFMKYPGGEFMSSSDAQALLANGTDWDYSILWMAQTMASYLASRVTVLTTHNPLGSLAKSRERELRDLCNKFTEETEYIYATKVNQQYDTVDYLYSRFPYQILITSIVAFGIVGFMLWSMIAPIRLASTILVPFFGIFGFAVLVYQKCALEWTNISAVSCPGSIFWTVPFFTFSLCIGLALDYDIFLVAKIFENRKLGLTTRASIVLATYETASVISAAGSIMIVCFMTEMIVPHLGLNQLGFIMIVAVFFDTFIVRSFMVPAVMSLAEDIGYWPTTVPTFNLLGVEKLDVFVQRRFRTGLRNLDDHLVDNLSFEEWTPANDAGIPHGLEMLNTSVQDGRRALL